MDIRGLSKFLGVSKSQIEILLARGEIPTPIRIGNLRRWHMEQISDWIKSITPQTAPLETPPSLPRQGRPRRRP